MQLLHNIYFFLLANARSLLIWFSSCKRFCNKLWKILTSENMSHFYEHEQVLIASKWGIQSNSPKMLKNRSHEIEEMQSFQSFVILTVFLSHNFLCSRSLLRSKYCFLRTYCTWGSIADANVRVYEVNS